MSDPGQAHVQETTCESAWCCGCPSHPIGKPWGWNYEAWERHNDEHHPLPEQPKTEYRDEDFA